jgi:peptidoglycan hydrolase CwlO-like protein
MSIRNALERRLRAELDLWNRQIQTLEAKAEQEESRADLQRQTYEKINALRKGVDEARQKLDDLKESGEEISHGVRERVETFMERMRHLNEH